MTDALFPHPVALVGAGPGDPELLTIKALRRLQNADVVVYDNLVGPGVMTLIPAGVECIYVGKKASKHTLPQAEISELLVRLVQAGKKVVRLKGGDPFVFGRGGEELATLQVAGIDVEIVPGITAALGAAASFGFPLTHREHAQSCVFVTGHLKDPHVHPDWAALARSNQTLVIYMGMHGLETIRRELIQHGLSPDTPAALVYKASLPDQQCYRTRLADLPACAQQHNIKPPALIVIGSVLNLAHPSAGF